MVAAANLLVIYKYCNKAGGGNGGGGRDAKNGRGYIDFQECIHVFHNLVPTEIALSEDIVACLTPNELHVFKVLMKEVGSGDGEDDDDDERHLHSISLYSFNSTDLDSSGASSSGGGNFASSSSQPWAKEANFEDTGDSVTKTKRVGR